MRIGTWIVSVAVLLASAWFVFESIGFSGGVTLGEPGPGRMPIAIGSLAVALAAALAVQAFVRKSEEAVRFPRLAAVGAFTAAVLVYAVIIPFIGYYAATGLFLIAVMALLRAAWRTTVGVAAGFLAFVLLIFDMLLGVPLP